MLSKDWNEAEWSFEKSLLLLHRFVGVGERKNIFRKDAPDDLSEESDDIHRIKRNVDADNREENVVLLIEEYPKYMVEVAILLGADDSDKTRNELNEAFQLGLALNELIQGNNFKRKSHVMRAEQMTLKHEIGMLTWIERFDTFKLKTAKSSLVDYKVSVYDNLKNLKEKFSKRAFANYILWRIVDFSTQFLDNITQGKIFELLRQTYGVVDKEQRWKLCTRMTNSRAGLASSSLYIRDYFSEESRAAVLDLVEMILVEFKRTIKAADWMDEETTSNLLNTVESLKVFMGYDVKLLDRQEIENYYGKLTKDFSESFFYQALQLNVHGADRALKHRLERKIDWTDYAKPTTSKASYNRKDNSICMKLEELKASSLLKFYPESNRLCRCISTTTQLQQGPTS